MTLGIEREGLAEPLRDLIGAGTPTLGTCAGLIMLDRDHLGPARHDRRAQRLRPPGPVLRGRPRPRGRRRRVRGVFIRAPWVEEHGDGVEVLAEVDGHPVAVRQGNIARRGLPPRARRTTPTLSTAWSCYNGGRRMRDQRADALAQILVRYSTKVQKGDVCVIQSTTTAEPLVQAVYEEVLRAGGLPIMQLATEEAAAAFYELATDDQLDWVPPTSKWAAENADVRIAMMADANTRALSQVDPKQAGAHAAGAQAADGDVDAARGRRGAPLVADAVPDARLRGRGGHVARRLRGLLLRAPAWPTTPTRSPPGSASPTRSSAWPSGSRARRRSTSRAPAPTSRWASPAAPGSRARASTTCPTASSSPARSRTRSRARSSFSFPATYGGREVGGRQVQLRGRQGRRRLRRARRGVPASRCSTPTRARAAWASWASAPTTASPPAPRRSCSTRRSAARCTWRSA